MELSGDGNVEKKSVVENGEDSASVEEEKTWR